MREIWESIELVTSLKVFPDKKDVKKKIIFISISCYEVLIICDISIFIRKKNHESVKKKIPCFFFMDLLVSRSLEHDFTIFWIDICLSVSLCVMKILWGL